MVLDCSKCVYRCIGMYNSHQYAVLDCLERIAVVYLWSLVLQGVFLVLCGPRCVTVVDLCAPTCQSVELSLIHGLGCLKVCNCRRFMGTAVSKSAAVVDVWAPA